MTLDRVATAPMRAVAAILVGIALVGCADYVVLDGIDPSAPNIVPDVGPDAAEIRTTATDDAVTPGVEGSILFVRLVSPDGVTILDRPFAFPNDRQRVPPGEYAMTVYWRGCNGNCGVLEGEDRFCEERITLAANDEIEIHVTPSQFIPGSRCAVSTAAVG